MMTKTWVCTFCGRGYGRSDILRRHYHCCQRRDGRPIPDRLPRGRVRRACDNCARLKLACDNEFPCETCLSHSLDCTRSRTSSISTEAAEGSTVSPTTQTAEHQSNQPLKREETRKTRLPFLANYARPDNKSLVSAFGIAPSGGRDIDLNSIGNVRPAIQSRDLVVDPAITASGDHTQVNDQYGQSQDTSHWSSLSPLPEFSEYSCTSLFSFEEDMEFWLIPSQDEWSEKGNFGSSNLDLAAINLVDELAHWLSSPSFYSHDTLRADFDTATTALKLFTSQNVQAFIHDYFRRWNHHSPIIHPGTFNALTASTPLLLAICLTGACLSSRADEVSSATLMLDMAEEFIFGHHDFECILRRSPPDAQPNLPKDVAALQAAFSISQIQLRKGSREKRKAIRTFRFDQLIAALKATDLLNCSIMDSKAYRSIYVNFECWERFGITEAGKRLVLGIFHLNVSFTLFYDMQPRLLAEDIPVIVPCAVDAFMALDAETCVSLLLGNPCHVVHTLPGVLNSLCSRDNILLTPHSLDVLHLFSIILGLLQLIWLSPRAPVAEGREQMMRIALRRWKKYWDENIAGSSHEDKERYGFALHAALEFWQLGNMLLDRDHARANAIRPPPQTL